MRSIIFNHLFVRLRLLTLLAVILLLLAVQVSAQDFLQRADEYLSEITLEKNFSGSVLVAKEGEILLNKGYGMANYEHDIPNTPKTKFRIGSVTKQFTSMLILQLAEDGKIDVEGKLSDYIPYYRKDTGDKITIHHLLTHTSGIPSYTGFPGFFRNDSRDRYSPEEFVKKYCSNDLEFEPGAQFRYNNSAYFILGAVIEEVTGKTYEECLQERIYSPLNMKDSGYDAFTPIIKNRASGYRKGDNGFENDDYLDMSIPYAAGSLYSTVEDLYLWDRALYTEKILTEDSKKKLFTPYISSYGYGWRISGSNGRKTISHTGGINGFSSILVRYVDDDAFIVILCNLIQSNRNDAVKKLDSLLFEDNFDRDH